MANSDMRDESILRKDELNNHFICISYLNLHNISIYNKTDIYQVLVSLDACQYIPEILMQKNNMGIIGIIIAGYENKIRIMGEVLEGIISEFLSIL